MRLIVALVGALLLVACAGSKGGPGSETVLTYTRSGGFAAFNDTLVVASDGSLTLTDKNGTIRRGTASEDDVKRLGDLVRGAEFRKLAPSYSVKGADQMTYTVAVPGVAKVSTMDGVEQPVVLAKVLGTCNELMGRVK